MLQSISRLFPEITKRDHQDAAGKLRKVLDTGGTNTIATSSGHIWNNASLHGAMMAHFSRHAERPQFKVWLLHALPGALLDAHLPGGG